MELLRGAGAPLCVGHRGAPALAPANTLESIRAAAACGVDAVELDVIEHGGRLVLCHSAAELVAETPALDDALALVRELGVGVQLDVKGRGREEDAAAAVARHGLLESALASSFSAASLLALAHAEPRLRRAYTYPQDRHGLSARKAVQPFVAPALAALRRTLPRRLPRLLRRVGAAAATLHWSVVSPLAVATCHAAGIAVWAWTVNEAELARELDALGCDAIITDDPRILRGA